MSIIIFYNLQKKETAVNVYFFCPSFSPRVRFARVHFYVVE